MVWYNIICVPYNTVPNTVNYNAIEQLNADSCPNTQIKEIGSLSKHSNKGNRQFGCWVIAYIT